MPGTPRPTAAPGPTVIPNYLFLSIAGTGDTLTAGASSVFVDSSLFLSLRLPGTSD